MADPAPASRLPAVLWPLAFLIGVWEGGGEGLWAAEPRLRYRERLVVAGDGRPLLRYRQETWSGEPPLPLHTEVGFLRPIDGGEAELTVVQAAGIIEVDRGPAQGSALELTSRAVHPEPSGLVVTAVRRRYRRAGAILHVLVQIGMHGEPLQDHVHARLHLVAPPEALPDPPSEPARG